jgi:NADPH2:quinone reductase
MMRAIQVSVPGDISALKLLKIPTPKLASNQILVNNKFSGVNFIDTYHRTGLYKLDLPFVPGRYDAVNCREGSGIVIEIGADVQEFAVGDRVAYTGTSTYAEYTAVNQGFGQLIRILC